MMSMMGCCCCETTLRRYKVFVQRHDSCDVSGAENAFLQKVDDALSQQNVKLDLGEMASSYGGLDNYRPSIVICPVTNRLGSSVDSALRANNCTGDSRVALLLFHHLPPHSPLHAESDRVLTDEKYTKFGCIVDVVFWQGTGVYKCEMNSLGVEKLTRFIMNDICLMDTESPT